VLDGITVSVGAGEIVCVLGASGSGKSTLLRLIAGVARPTTGRILLDHDEVAGPSAFVEPERRRVGMVFQDYALFPHLTVAANIGFGLRTLARPEADEVVRSLLNRMDLSRFAASYPHVLSGGERQRVALARALAPRPRVLLMDEPFSSLDGVLREQVRDQTTRLLRDSGTTVVVVTHDPDEALRIADRVALIDRGRLVECGTPQELYASPATIFAARLFGHGNELRGICRAGCIATPLGAFDAAHLPEAAAGSVFIRPQQLRLIDEPSDIAARVLRTTFLGDACQVVLDVNGLDVPLTVRTACNPSLEAGASVFLAIDRQAVRVVAHDVPEQTPTSH
jgi:iron(III) transport system ATP-binding protein